MQAALWSILAVGLGKYEVTVLAPVANPREQRNAGTMADYVLLGARSARQLKERIRYTQSAQLSTYGAQTSRERGATTGDRDARARP